MKNGFKRVLAIAMALAMVSVLFVGCSGSTTDTTATTATTTETTTAEATTGDAIAAADGDVQEALSAYPTGGDVVLPFTGSFGIMFNPYQQGTIIEYGWMAMQPLAYYKSDGNFYPCLVDTWTVDPDEHSITVSVKDGITFSNGYPLTNEDVYFTLNSRLEYGTASTIGNPTSVEMTEDGAVKVTWADYSLSMELWVLTQYIYSKATFDEIGLDAFCATIVGTGPYMLDEYVTDVSMHFVRNPNYWDTSVTAGPDTFTVKIFNDSTTQMAAFMTGELSKFTSYNPTEVATLTAAGYTPDFGSSETAYSYFIIPLTLDETAPLANQEVRQALYLYGIDWDTIATNIGGDLGYHSSVIGNKGMPYYQESLDKCSYDPEKAKAMLAEAGYPDGFEIEIFNIAGYFDALSAMLQQSLEKIGVTATITNIDATLMYAYVGGTQAQTGLCYFMQSTYANQQLDRFTKHLSPTATVGGASHWSDNILNLWETARRSTTAEEQNENLYNFVDAYVNEECVFWPAYNVKLAYFFNNYHETSLAQAACCGFDPFEVYCGD